MQKYINDIIQIGPFLLSGISLVMFLYSCRKSAAPKEIKYFWAGMLLFSLPAMTGKSESVNDFETLPVRI